MRRVGRGGSPEVVVGPCDYSSPCSSAETSFRELDDVFLQTQTRIWLGEVLHVRFDEETSIADLLADGELLFQVSKVVWRMLLKKHAELKHSKVYIHERATFRKSGGRYMAYPKVDSFVRICQILGLIGVDLFSPSDVVEKRDTRRVCMCVRSLSKKARTKDLNVPDFDIVTYTIAMPTYMVGSIRRRLEQSWWSSANSSGCAPSVDLKEIYSQRSLDSDYLWHHSSCSESDDAEDMYREYELQSPASITSYDDADISGLTGEDLPGSGSVAEENIYPSQDFFALTWDQDESVFKGVKSVETYLDTSIHFPHSNSTSNSNLQVRTVCCTKSFPPCKTCQAHVDAGTFFSFMEDMSCLQTKTNSGTEIHKFDFVHSSDNPSSSRNLATETDSCITVDAKEEKYEASTSLKDDTIAEFLPQSYRNLGTVKREEFLEATVVPPTSQKQLTCIMEDHDTLDSTCMLLLDKVLKENGRPMLEYNRELSECNSAGLLESLCEKRHAEEHVMDINGKVAWDNCNIFGLNADSDASENLLVMSPDPTSGNSDSTIQSIKNHYSFSSETVADDQSWSHVEALNVNPRHLENKMMCEVGNTAVSLVANQNSGNTVTVICENVPGTDKDEVTLDGLLGGVYDEGSSMCTLNEALPGANALESMSGKLCNLNVGTSDLDMDSTFCHESQASATDRGTHTPDLQNQAPHDSGFLGVPHTDSVSEELSQSQVSLGCSESNSNYSLRNKQCSQFMDALQGASDSSADRGKQSIGSLSCNGDAFSAVEEQTNDFHAELHNQNLSSDPLSRVNDSLVEKDLISKKLADEDGKSYCFPFGDMKQIPADNFCRTEVESQSRANSISKDGAANVDTKVHQIVVIDGKSCSQSVQKQMVNNLLMEGFRKQTTGSEQTEAKGEGESLAIETGKACSLCRRTNDEPEETKQEFFMESCTGNNMNCCIKDKVPQDIDSKNICDVPKGRCLAHNETTIGSLHSEETSVWILHPLDANPRESEGSEELCQGNIQKMVFDVSVNTHFPMIEFSEGQVSIGTCHDHLDQAEACALRIGGSHEDCLHSGLLDTNIGKINPEIHSHLSSSNSHSVAHCESVSGADYVELGSSYMQREESPYSTACVLDMKNKADQHIEMNNRRQPFMDEGANSMYQNDFACTQTPKNDEEDGELTLVRPDGRKKEEAAGLESKPGRNMLLKSFAGGMTVLGALFLLLHFRRRRDTGNAVTNVKLQTEKASHEKRPDKDKNTRLYPAEKFKF